MHLLLLGTGSPGQWCLPVVPSDTRSDLSNLLLHVGALSSSDERRSCMNKIYLIMPVRLINTFSAF